MELLDHYNRMVDLCDEAVADAIRWKRGNRLFLYGFWILLAGAVFLTVAGVMGESLLGTIIGTLLMVGNVIMIGNTRSHGQWIDETRERWERSREGYIADRIAYLENL